MQPELVIVGGGPAGVTTALAVLRHAPALAERTIVLEKQIYPREKYCAGATGARADRLLARLGVRVDVPSIPIRGVSFLLPEERRVSLRHGEAGRIVRRLEFDAALAREASAAGVVIETGVAVTGLARSADRILLATTAGPIEAHAIVGADGVGSVVRRAIGLPRGRYAAQVVEIDSERVDGDPPSDVIHFDASDRSLAGYAWDFPTLVDGRELVCRGIYELRRIAADHPAPAGGPPGRERDVGAQLDRYLAARGLEPGRYRKKRFAERGLAPSEPVSRPRVLLAGEAAGIDPLTGEGIAQAIEYGELAGRYLAEAFRGGDLDFASWPDVVAASSLGRNLWLRRLVAAWFYGAARQDAERFLAACPEALELGLQSFAGDRFDRRTLARAFLRIIGHGARFVPALAWRALAGEKRLVTA